jgi:hypothetical protein
VTLTDTRTYLLAIIEHTTRQVPILGATGHPTAAWVTQPVRNLATDLQHARCQARFRIRDHDGKYPAMFDTILADTGTRVMQSGVQTPPMNTIMQRWIQSCRHQLLDRMPVWHQTHPPHAPHHYQRHHNTHRPHRGISNAKPQQPLPEPITEPATATHLHIRTRDRLDGTIHEHRHAA